MSWGCGGLLGGVTRSAARTGTNGDRASSRCRGCCATALLPGQRRSGRVARPGTWRRSATRRRAAGRCGTGRATSRVTDSAGRQAGLGLASGSVGCRSAWGRIPGFRRRRCRRPGAAAGAGSRASSRSAKWWTAERPAARTGASRRGPRPPGASLATGGGLPGGHRPGPSTGLSGLVGGWNASRARARAPAGSSTAAQR
jgi:hypothetical protein